MSNAAQRLVRESISFWVPHLKVLALFCYKLSIVILWCCSFHICLLGKTWSIEFYLPAFPSRWLRSSWILPCRCQGTIWHAGEGHWLESVCVCVFFPGKVLQNNQPQTKHEKDLQIYIDSEIHVPNSKLWEFIGWCLPLPQSNLSAVLLFEI